MDLCVYKIFPFKTYDFAPIPRGPPNDWSAIYFQFSIEHALGYATDKKPDEGIICLARLKLRTDSKLPIHIIKDPEFGQLNLTGAEKATLLKQKLNIPSDQKLMDAVNGLVILYDNNEDYELIVSHNVLNNHNFNSEILAQLKIHNHVISHWRKYGHEEWIPLSPVQMLNPKYLSDLIAK